MYNPTYHEASEGIDDELFTDFVNHTKLFKSVKRNRQFSDIDYIGVDLKGRDCSIELKKRNIASAKYPTTYIEAEKAWKLVNRYEQFGYQPLYINFYNDCVLIFDLKKYRPDIDFVYKKLTIFNKGYDEKQKVWRVELPNTDAIRFTKEDNGEYVYN